MGTYTVASEEDIDIFNIGAALKSKIGKGPTKGKLKAELDFDTNDSSSKYQMTIHARCSGDNFLVPLNPTFDQMEETIKEFNEQYEQNIDEGIVRPIGFGLSSISDYAE